MSRTPFRTKPRVAIAAVVLAATLPIAHPSSAAEHVVRMAGADYSPNRIDARVGDTIRFVNDDGMNHNVFVPTLDHGVDLGRQEPGDDRVMTLGRAGTFEAECVFHGRMLLTVSVAR